MAGRLCMLQVFLILAACATGGMAAGPSIGCATPKCPPPHFNTVDVNLTEFVAAPWYVQMQEPLAYQAAADLFCVRASYKPVDLNNLLAGLSVLNYGNHGAVNGPAEGSGANGSYFSMFAVPQFPGSAKDSGKLLVGVGSPPGSQTLNATQLAQLGEYWIVALGKSKTVKKSYEWAIISAGAPSRNTSGGCSTGSSLGAYNAGFWLFSRKPVDPINTAVMRRKGKELGFDLSNLLKVVQQGCLYKGVIV